MSHETKVTEANQTQVPAELRAKHGVTPGTIVVWEEGPAGEITVRFRRKYELKDLIGAFELGRTRDAVADKKRAQRRGL